MVCSIFGQSHVSVMCQTLKSQNQMSSVQNLSLSIQYTGWFIGISLLDYSPIIINEQGVWPLLKCLMLQVTLQLTSVFVFFSSHFLGLEKLNPQIVTRMLRASLLALQFALADECCFFLLSQIYVSENVRTMGDANAKAKRLHLWIRHLTFHLLGYPILSHCPMDPMTPRATFFLFGHGSS